MGLAKFDMINEMHSCGFLNDRYVPRFRQEEVVNGNQR
jgi:hypothetical protein